MFIKEAIGLGMVIGLLFGIVLTKLYDSMKFESKDNED
jgi:hypothetical protein